MLYKITYQLVDVTPGLEEDTNKSIPRSATTPGVTGTSSFQPLYGTVCQKPQPMLQRLPDLRGSKHGRWRISDQTILVWRDSRKHAEIAVWVSVNILANGVCTYEVISPHVNYYHVGSSNTCIQIGTKDRWKILQVGTPNAFPRQLHGILFQA